MDIHNHLLLESGAGGATPVLPSAQSNMLFWGHSGHYPGTTSTLFDNGGGAFTTGETLAEVRNDLALDSTYDITVVTPPGDAGDPVILDCNGVNAYGHAPFAAIDKSPSEFAMSAIVSLDKDDVTLRHHFYGAGDNSFNRYIVAGASLDDVSDPYWTLMVNFASDFSRWKFGDEITASGEIWYAVIFRGDGSNYFLDLKPRGSAWQTIDSPVRYQIDGTPPDEGAYFNHASFAPYLLRTHGIWRSHRSGSPHEYWSGKWVDGSWCHGPLDDLPGHRAYMGVVVDSIP